MKLNRSNEGLVFSRKILPFAVIAAALFVAGCQTTQTSAPAQRAALTNDESMELLSYLISLNLQKYCPKEFGLTNDQTKLARAKELRQKAGEERFNRASGALKPVTDCNKALADALRVRTTVPYTEFKRTPRGA